MRNIIDNAHGIIKDGLLAGLTNKQIAKNCNIKVAAIKWHLTNLYRAENVKNRLEYTTKVLLKQSTKDRIAHMEILLKAAEAASKNYDELKVKYVKLLDEHNRALLTLDDAKLKIMQPLSKGVSK